MTLPFDVDDRANSNFVDEDIESLGRMESKEEVEYPKAMLKIPKEKLAEIRTWVHDHLHQLTDEYETKRETWAHYEQAYKAHPEAPKTRPFIGASNDNIPLIASMVDPVHARLETGVFKQDPPFRQAALRKSMKKYEKPLERFVNFYMKYIVNARQVISPRLLELAKMGTCVLYVDYRIERSKRMFYEGDKVAEETITTFRGPKIEGVDLGDFLFSALYQHVQDCPLVARRIRTTVSQLREWEYQGWVTNVDAVAGFAGRDRTTVEDAIEDNGDLRTINADEQGEIVVYEVFFKYALSGGNRQMLRALVHLDGTSHDEKSSPLTILNLRLNDAWHGQYPFVVINYTLNNQSILGTGLCEMVYPFQEAVKRYHQLAQDNAFIANAKMFVVKRGTPGLEGDLKVYAGRTIYADNPGQDVISLSMGDSYQSTLMERQNLMGLAEKRTGVSDYMVGRESPIVGSRATATSTLALIQEGTKRVEQVMENIRTGMSDLIEMMLHLWAQHGVDLDDLPFGDSDDVVLLEEFFKSVAPQSRLKGAFSLSIGVTEATTNRQVQQQMQLSLIQVMQSYTKQVLELGQLALQMSQQSPQFGELIQEVLTSAHTMYRDLLSRYDIPNAEEYLPDVTNLISSMGTPGDGQGGPGGAEPISGGPNQLGGMDAILEMVRGSAGSGATQGA